MRKFLISLLIGQRAAYCPRTSSAARKPPQAWPLRSARNGGEKSRQSVHHVMVDGDNIEAVCRAFSAALTSLPHTAMPAGPTE